MRRLGDRGPRAAGIALVLALVALAAAGAARAELSVGMRFGWSDVSDEFFTGSGELGGTNLIGAQLGFDLVPMVEVEVAGEYISQEFSFREGVIGGFEAVGEGEWEDLALYATGRLRVLGFAFLPLHGYVGGGLNIHWAELKLNEVTELGADAGPGGLEEEIEAIAGERSELGWHVVGGVRLAPPGAALSAMAEVRFQKGLDPDQLPKSTAIYLGVSIKL